MLSTIECKSYQVVLLQRQWWAGVPRARAWRGHPVAEAGQGRGRGEAERGRGWARGLGQEVVGGRDGWTGVATPWPWPVDQLRGEGGVRGVGARPGEQPGVGGVVGRAA